MGPLKCDHNKQVITLIVITLSGFHCIWENKGKTHFYDIRSTKCSFYNECFACRLLPILYDHNI